MNKTPIAALVALASVGLSPLYAEKPGRAAALKRPPSHSDLAKRMEKRSNPLAGTSDLTTLDRSAIEQKKKREDRGGLISRSSILSHSGHWTMVPKGAVLHVPARFRERVGGKPAGKLLPWKEFYLRNRGWIFTQSVNMANARGEKALQEEVLKNHRTLGRVVVAVLHHGPISVKAPQSKEATQTIAPR